MWVRGPGSNGRADPLGHVFRTFPRLTDASQFDNFVQACRGLSYATAAIASDEKGEPWLQAGYPHTWYHHVLGPNEHSCQNETEYDYGAISASSRHNGGVNVLMLDDSVHFVKNSIDLEIWRALGTRNGGEQLDAF